MMTLLNIRREYRYVNWALLGLCLAFLLYPLGVLWGGLPTLASGVRAGEVCVSCGLTRSVVALYGGCLAESWAYHPLGGMAVGIGVAQLGFRFVLMMVEDGRWCWFDLVQLFICGLGFRLLMEVRFWWPLG